MDCRGANVHGIRGDTFGARLRRLREARGLSQDQLAERSGLSANAVGALERGERRRPYPHTVQVLAEALGLSVEDREALTNLVLSPRGAAHRLEEPSSKPPLPVPPTPLKGRESDRAWLIDQLTPPGPRLVTLTGPGGVGKTRLALQVAADAVARFQDGVAFVALAPVADSMLVTQAIAEAIGVRETGGQALGEVLRAYLQERQMLLVLDNMEHLLAAAANVAHLLEESSGLRVLVTSRAPLHLRGERIYPVEPLGLPDLSDVPSPEDIADSPAVQLFVERAREVWPVFALDRANVAAVAAICRRLDGLPLAIELAAAWIRVLPPLALLARLDQTLPILTRGARDLPARQRTMEQTIAWSYDLLDPPAQALFRRLAVFAGGWTVEGAEAIGQGLTSRDEDVLGLLAVLVEHSLVARQPGNEGRFRLLEPVRQYAQGLLEQHGESEEARQQHATSCLLLAETAEATLGGAGADAWWLQRLETEHDNLRGALAWLLQRDDAAGALRLAAALWPFWHYRSHLSEGRRWLQQALVRGTNVPTAVRARALLGSAFLAHYQGDDRQALALVDEGLAIARSLPDKQETIPRRRVYLLALLVRGLIAEDQGDYRAALPPLEEANQRASESGDRTWGAVTLLHLGIVAYGMGDATTAESRLWDALARFRALPDHWGAANALDYLGLVAVERGDQRQAAALFVESLTLFREIGSLEGLAGSLSNVAVLLAMTGMSVEAARLFGAADALARRIGSLPKMPERAVHQRGIDVTRSALGDFTFSALFEDGRTEPEAKVVEEVIARVTDIAATPTTRVTPRSYPAGLSEREVEVLRLVSAGMTNAQVAERLFLSRRTVEAHLRRIYDKIDLSSRTEAIRFAEKHHLL